MNVRTHYQHFIDEQILVPVAFTNNWITYDNPHDLKPSDLLYYCTGEELAEADDLLDLELIDKPRLIQFNNNRNCILYLISDAVDFSQIKHSLQEKVAFDGEGNFVD